jgi:hypothetical protein
MQDATPDASERWGGAKWIEKNSVGSPSFEGLKGDFEG